LLAPLLLIACDGGRQARLRFEIALPSDEQCSPDSLSTIADEAPCTTVRLYREDSEGVLQTVRLLRPDDDHGMEGAVELRFDSAAIEFDARLESGPRHDLVIVVYGGRPSAPIYGARLENVDLAQSEIRVRLYPFADWSCPGEGDEPLAPRAFHQAVRVGNGDVLLLGGITGDEIGPASAAVPPRGLGGLPQRTVEVYDADEHRFLRVAATDQEGQPGFGRVLFSAYYVGPADGEQRYRVRVIGGFELPADRATPLLDFDNGGSFVPVGAPFTPSDDASVGQSVDLIYDARERTLTFEAEFDPTGVPRGGAVMLSNELDDGTRAVLIGLALTADGPLPASQYYTFDAEGTATGALDLAHPRLGASVTPIEGLGGFLVWGGNVSPDAPMVNEMAGEILAQDGSISAIPAGAGLPGPVAFHSALRVGSETVVMVGGLVIEASGFLLATQPADPIFALRADMTTGVAFQDVPDGDYTSTILHTVTRVPGVGLVVVGGATVELGDRLTAVRNAGVITGTAATLAYDGSLDDLSEPRFGHTTTLLSGGRLLVVGGLGPGDNGLEALGLAEVLYLEPRPTEEIPDGACVDVEEDEEIDAGVDAGQPSDAGPIDAGPVDAGPLCPDVSGNWAVVVPAGTCGAAVAGNPTSISLVGTCTYTAADPDPLRPALIGTFTLDAAGNLSGTLNAGSTGDMACGGMLAGDGTLNAVCGGCTLTFGRI
jgi:hypothetical protein